MPKKTYGEHTPETIREIADRLAELAATIRTVSESMSVHKTKTLTIETQDQMMRGLTYLENWAIKATMEFAKSRRVALSAVRKVPPPE